MDSGVVYLKGQDNEADLWDDSALIEAYDKAVNSFKKSLNKKEDLETDNNNEEVEEEEKERENNGEGGNKLNKNKKHKSNKEKFFNNNKNKKLNKNNSRMNWKVGDECWSVYEVDGLWYKAEIIKIMNNIDNNNDDKCIVKYDFYENLEEKSLNDLIEFKNEDNYENFNYIDNNEEEKREEEMENKYKDKDEKLIDKKEKDTKNSLEIEKQFFFCEKNNDKLYVKLNNNNLDEDINKKEKKVEKEFKNWNKNIPSNKTSKNYFQKLSDVPPSLHFDHMSKFYPIKSQSSFYHNRLQQSPPSIGSPSHPISFHNFSQSSKSPPPCQIHHPSSTNSSSPFHHFPYPPPSQSVFFPSYPSFPHFIPIQSHQFSNLKHPHPTSSDSTHSQTNHFLKPKLFPSSSPPINPSPPTTSNLAPSSSNPSHSPPFVSTNPPNPSSFSNSHNFFSSSQPNVPFSIPLLPPPPPNVLDIELDNDSDALYAMLVSWYMNGYYTGYYKGLEKKRK